MKILLGLVDGRKAITADDYKNSFQLVQQMVNLKDFWVACHQFGTI